MVWRTNVPKKVKFLIWLVFLGRVNTVDRLARRTSFVGAFCCMLCQKAEENLNHLFLGLPVCTGCVDLFSAGVRC